jgi:hypothetical protein
VRRVKRETWNSRLALTSLNAVIWCEDKQVEFVKRKQCVKGVGCQRTPHPPKKGSGLPTGIRTENLRHSVGQEQCVDLAFRSKTDRHGVRQQFVAQRIA